LAHAAPASSTSLELLTWPELKAQIAAGSTTVLVPIGGTEQNGAHMALGKQKVRARLLAGRTADKLGNTIVAPVVGYVSEGSVGPADRAHAPPGHDQRPGAGLRGHDGSGRAQPLATRASRKRAAR
jgi:creatinine amidohydrolase